MGGLVVVVAAVLLIGTSLGSVYSVDHSFEETPAVWMITEGGMYAGRDPDRPGKEGKGEIMIDMTFVRDKKKGESAIEMVMMRPEQARMLGYMDPETNEKVLCCTEELVERQVPGCREPGRLITTQPRTVKSNPFNIISGLFTEPLDPEVIDFSKSETSAVFNDTLIVHRTGIYSLLFASCDEANGEVQASGTVTFRNPYGYLPGQLYGFIPCYRALLIIYSVLLVMWGLLCFARRQKLLMLHYWIGGLIVLGLLESLVHHVAYARLNATGNPTCCPLPAGVVLGDVLSVMKSVPSKILVLLICMGWGIVHASVGPKAKWITIFGAAAFVLTLVHEIAISRSHNEQVPAIVKIFISLPMYATDMLLIVWMFAELRSTRNDLHDRGATEKYKLYRRFASALYAFFFSIFVWGCLAVWLAMRSTTANSWRYINWKIYFLVGGVPPGGVMWDLLYMALLIVTMGLLVPGNQTSMYEYRPEDTLDTNVALTTVDDFREGSSDGEL